MINGNGFGQSAQNVDVFFNAADDERRRFEILTDPSQITLHLRSQPRIAKKRFTVLRRENEVREQLGKRLWHGISPFLGLKKDRIGDCRKWAQDESRRGQRRLFEACFGVPWNVLAAFSFRAPAGRICGGQPR